MLTSNGDSLKIKQLQSLLQHYVPSEKQHSFSDPKELSYVLFNVKTHKLLAACATCDEKLIDSFKLVVDSWVNRLLTLASSKSPNKCWVGLCLLGISCQECTSERFLSSYVDWLNKFLSQIQDPQTVPHYVKVASCASLSDLFIRLSNFPNAKKDATSHATRVIPAALKLLNEDTSSSVLEESTCLIRNMINFFPISIQRHYDNVESAISVKILSGQCSASVLEKLGSTLSLLPRSRGDADSWSLLMDKVLWCTNGLLTDILQGLENEAKSAETVRALLPSRKESPAPLGGSEQISDLSTARPERLLVARIMALLQCCSYMLRNPYPVIVSIPICGIVSLVERVLMIDNSLSHPSFEFMTVMKPEFISTEILLLQLPALEILSAVVEGLKSQILTHAASIARLVNEYLKRCKVPDLRRKAYLIVKDILHSMGVGAAVHLSQDIISNVFIDLNIDENGQSATGNAKVSTIPRQKKQKLSNVEKAVQEQSSNTGSEVDVPHNLVPVSSRIGALETLEELLHVGGSVKSESWRGNVDRLLFNVATNSYGGEHSEDFQLAALRALLASLLSPNRARPLHLGQSLELFRRGAQEASTKVADYCCRAFTSLEVLVHPRALPLLNYSNSDEYKFQNPGNKHGEPESEDDDLNENWLGNDDEMDVQDTVMQDDNERRNYLPDKYPCLDTVSMPEKNEDRQIENSNEELPVRNTCELSAENIKNSSARVLESEPEPELESTRGVLMEKGAGLLPESKNEKVNEAMERISELNPETENAKGNEAMERISETLARMERHGILGFESDDETHTDLIPDIIDGDPDSD